ncbi:MAG: rRNA-binding ribosome biosynthesis protein rpf2 [Bogoriella megaspora]|nr:MAG: rRNA-binding ribosome biosynthesis protein rpf2 [Bogoriella megaspora]
MLRQIKPRNARSKRALEKKEPHLVENPKSTLFLRYTSCSLICQLALHNFEALKKPHIVKFNKGNSIHPFEDPSSLEFFSEKNDASLIVYGSNSKKRPNCMTLIRCFNHKVLDMLELYIDPDTFRTLEQFKTRKCSVGLKPMICFSGTPFESPTPTPYTLAKSLFLDLFHVEDVQNVDVTGLEYMISISAGDEVEGQPPPQINFRVYLINTKKSGQKVPRIELEEMGPRIDFRVGRIRQPDESILKEALKKPKQLEPKQKKNIETDLVGDKIGRIHMSKQDFSALQSRKMKGLKRSRVEDDDAATTINTGRLQNGDAEAKRSKI